MILYFSNFFQPAVGIFSRRFPIHHSYGNAEKQAEGQEPVKG
jgi:hypothetical protein